eukprot:241511_1
MYFNTGDEYMINPSITQCLNGVIFTSFSIFFAGNYIFSMLISWKLSLNSTIKTLYITDKIIVAIPYVAGCVFTVVILQYNYFPLFVKQHLIFYEDIIQYCSKRYSSRSQLIVVFVSFILIYYFPAPIIFCCSLHISQSITVVTFYSFTVVFNLISHIIILYNTTKSTDESLDNLDMYCIQSSVFAILYFWFAAILWLGYNKHHYVPNNLLFYTFYILIEMILLMLMILITLVVEYDSKYHILIFIAFINYICPNFPMFKSFMMYKFIAFINQNTAYSFAVKNSNGTVDDICNRLYAGCHCYVYHAIANIDAFDDGDDNEQKSLIVRKYKHVPNSAECLKLQYKFMEMDNASKIVYLHRMLNVEQFLQNNKHLYCIAVSAIFAHIYPFGWYIFYYDKMQCNLTSITSYICLLYTSYCYISMMLLLYFLYVNGLFIDGIWCFIRLWNVVRNMSVFSSSKAIYNQLGVVHVLMNRIELDIAYVILSYIGIGPSFAVGTYNKTTYVVRS